MQKTTSLSLVACLAFCGCGAFHRSGTWSTVVSARFNTQHEADPSKVYASQLSRTLASANVEHKVVTYQYRYRTRLREEAIGTRTAVVYRDNTDSKNPWWLMDDRLRKPVWLPGQELNRQVSFYVRDSAQVVEAHDVHGGGQDKTMIAGAASGSMLARNNKQPAVRQLEAAGIVRVAAVRRTERSQILVPRTPMRKPAAAASMPLLAMEHSQAWLRPARFAPVSSAPSFVAVPAPIATDSFAAVFRIKHGTSFDPVSSIDRRKMAELHHVGAERAF